MALSSRLPSRAEHWDPGEVSMVGESRVAGSGLVASAGRIWISLVIVWCFVLFRALERADNASAVGMFHVQSQL